MVHARRGVRLHELPRGPGGVEHVGRRDRPILEDRRLPSRQHRLEDPGDASLRRRTVRRPPEQALDAQHIRAGRVAREPLPQHLRYGVDAARIRPVVLGIWPAGRSVEDKIAAVVNQRGTRCRRRSRERPDAECVGLERLDWMVFRAVNIAVVRAVDDDLRPQPSHHRVHRRAVRDVEIGPAERRHLVGRDELIDDGGAKLAPRADDGDSHYRTTPRDAVTNSAIVSTTARCCSTVSSP